MIVRTADNVILTWDDSDWMMVECVPGQHTDTDFETSGNNSVAFFRKEWAEVAVRAIALRAEYVAKLKALVDSLVTVDVE